MIRNRRRLGRALGAIASIAVLAYALWFLHHEFRSLSHDAVVQHIRSMPFSTLLVASGLAALSYLVMTGYDAAALRYLGRRIPWRQSALAAFMAYAIGHNIGFVALSGGSVRFRMYGLAGLTASEIARIIVFVSGTFWLGASGLLGIALIAPSKLPASVLHLSPSFATAIGILLVALPCTYFAAAIRYRDAVALGNWRIPLPAPRLVLAQFAIAIADLVCAAATLYVLLAPLLATGFLPFLAIYLLAIAAGLVSGIPGGVGVFEAVLVAALPGVGGGALLGTIIVYRVIYYIAPLVLALLLLIRHEVVQHGVLLRRTTKVATAWFSAIAPQVVGLSVFLAGVVLLVSGAMPAVEMRLRLIERGIPLPLLELSHLAGSVVGVGLMVIARGLFRRLHGAYRIALVALLAGSLLSLLKGLDYEEALILGGIAFGLLVSRDEFYRREPSADAYLSVQWIVTVAGVLALATWVGFFSFRHVEYSGELWWQFAFDAEAPRMLRASLVAAITALALMVWRGLRSGAAPARDGDEDIGLVRTVIAASGSCTANLALLGDKRFLWSQDRSGFIMYRTSGRSWIAMGDPVGPQPCREELAWAFRERVDRDDGRPVFYQVSDDSLGLYVDLGLTLSKLGETAMVPLRDFTLEGSARAALRHADSRVRKLGATIAVVPRADVDAIEPRLRQISDDWLADKAAAEKGFSLGAYSVAYMSNFDCAVLRVDDAIVAFANLWAAPAGGEIAVDLMRFSRDAPKGAMDFLLIELMVWARNRGYEWFNLGMAPLSGLERRPLAPLWHKLGHLVFTHGENFYNFEGLRRYKEKFDPVWRPRYLACPGGWLDLPACFFDVARLISGGVGGMLRKP